MKYESIIKEYFIGIINEYSCKYYGINENSAVFIGRGYAFKLIIHLGEV